MLDQQNTSHTDESVSIKIISERKDMVGICTISGSSGQKNVDLYTIQEELQKENIVYGIDQQALLELLSEYRKTNKKFIKLSAIVAKGQPAIPGKDGFVEVLVPPVAKVNIQKDGSADFRNISVFRKVKKGDVVGIKRPPIPGKDGVDIYNKIAFSEASKEGDIEHGENIEFRTETQEYVALKGGIFEESEDKIHINTILKVDSHVGLETGNIDYDGEVHIRGNIEREAVVKAKGDISVDGVIESGQVISGGSIRAKLGINTKREHEMVALGNIQTNYIENSNIFAHQDIIVQNSILGSKVTSLQNIIMPSSKSTISGSQIYSYANIEVGTIGTPSGTNVQIVIGKHALNAEKHDELKKEFTEIKRVFYTKLEQVKVLKEKVEKLHGQLTKAQIEIMKTQFTEYKKISTQKEILQVQEEKYRMGIYNPNPVQLIVKSKIYSGVEITYRKNVIQIDTEYSNVIFTFDPTTGQYQIKTIQS